MSVRRHCVSMLHSLLHGRPLLAAMLVLMLSCAALAADKLDPAEKAPASWPPKGSSVKIPITRDVWISGIGKEAVGNNGGAPKWKLKGLQEYTLFDADLSAIKGKLVTGALLHVQCVSLDAPALRVSVATVATPWAEGTGNGYAEQPGSACFNSPELGKRNWAYPGSSLLDATWGKGNTLWRFAEATAADKAGWQEVAVEPDVVAANLAGLAHGYAVMDDVGSIWSYKGGDSFTFTNFPNRFFASKEQKNAAPYLEVWTEGADAQPPGPVTDISAATGGMPLGTAVVKWHTPADKGGGHTLGFNVTCKAAGKEQPVPRYLIPMAGPAGEEVRMILQDLDITAGAEVELSIAAVDSVGNVGKAVSKSFKVSAEPESFNIVPTKLAAFEPSEKLPQVGELKVAVLDLIDKVEAKSGKMVPDHPAGYKGGNHLWSADKKLIRLQSARNETVHFQVNLEGKAKAVTARLEFAGAAEVKPSVHYFDYVQAGSAMMPDAVLPLKAALAIPNTADPQAAEQANASLLCQMHVGHEAKPGPHAGKLTLEADGSKLELAVELTIWDFTLPNKLSFVPEMNCYGTANPEGGLEYYRVAHEHRTCLNRLYYGWNGQVRDNAAPPAKGDGFDWQAYDKSFGPLFDGSAFKDLPRKSEPLDLFYLPFNEHWPMDVYKSYHKSYWADEAFPKEYTDGFRRSVGEFARHFDQKGWHETVFQFYLNNKVYYKAGKPFESVTAPWCLDEPANVQDFWALRWYGILFHQGADPVAGKARFWNRSDVSRSQFDRDMLWGVIDIEVMGGFNDQKRRMKADEGSLRDGRNCYTVYGSANNPADPNVQPVVWCLTAWCSGSIGVLPWQTVATRNSWDKADQLALFYAGEGKSVIPSVRLKAFTRGQQDVEYLTLLAELAGAGKSEKSYLPVMKGVQKMVNLSGKIRKTSEEDAGTISFDKADPAALWALRVSVAEMVSAKKPPYKRSYSSLSPVKMDVTKLPRIGYVSVAPKLPPSAPDMD